MGDCFLLWEDGFVLLWDGFVLLWDDLFILWDDLILLWDSAMKVTFRQTLWLESRDARPLSGGLRLRPK